jgi:hypothetical protein
MKPTTLALAVLCALGGTATADENVNQRMRREWCEVGTEAKAGIAYSNYLLELPCDSALNAAARFGFARMDAMTLATYNSGLRKFPSRPEAPETPAPPVEEKPKAKDAAARPARSRATRLVAR